ncbi:ABC transporter permease [Bacillus sp. FJAT-49732]|uniref:ABC transporter permease n=1 Tax=Lederbergia citrisecunda TaxID=2833583 RepID=A0A942TKF4_9BACI|nr:ABC transporter permease [Lederbergia citrisecunda]MBS4198778.1 ABC transporter permease [Lederbergia citrisecunda]
MKNVLINPVLNKEFKLRFRSFRTFLGILTYLIAIGIVVIGYMLLETSMGGGSQFIRPSQSRVMFMVLAYLQLGLILFITPGLTSGVISGERERQTLNILLTTAQSSTSIIFSKLFSSISYLLLLLAASLPFYSLVFLFGGVSPTTIMKVMGFYLYTIFVFGSFGLLFSTLIRRTIVSMISTFGVTLFLSGGAAFLYLISTSYYHAANIQKPMVLPYIFAAFNPPIVFSGLFDISIKEAFKDQTGISFPLIWSYFIIYTILALLALLVSIKKLRPNMNPKKG